MSTIVPSNTAVEGETIEFMSTIKAFDSVLLVVQQTAIVLSLSAQRGALSINLTRRCLLFAWRLLNARMTKHSVGFSPHTHTFVA
jgi:hypothetical protein